MRSFTQPRLELVKKEKLAALGEMSALVAHEIRNPLTAVRGFAQRVQRKVADQPRLAQSCQIIIDEVDRLNKVIVDVLDFARRLEPQMGDHSLNLLVQDVLNLEAETLQQRGIQIVTDCAPALPPVHMDPGQIRQVLLNLIANARGAMGEKGGGALTLRTRRCTDGVQCLDVVDTGPGITNEMQEKIFTPLLHHEDTWNGARLGRGRGASPRTTAACSRSNQRQDRAPRSPSLCLRRRGDVPGAECGTGALAGLFSPFYNRAKK